MATNDNILSAFANEAKAYIKYLSFAAAAEREGHRQAARLFRGLAEAEKIHAQNHLAYLGEILDTEGNLLAAIDGETYEFTQMYPTFIAQAEKEGNHRAASSFGRTLGAEKGHGVLLKKALDKLGHDKDFDIYVCSSCGHVTSGDSPEKCTGCGASSDKIRIVD